MNKLSRTERAAIIRCLVEGNSIRSTARMTGAARNTITTLLVQLGTAQHALYGYAEEEQISFELVTDGTKRSWTFEYDKNADVLEAVASTGDA